MLYENEDVKKIAFEGGKFLKTFLIESGRKVKLKKVDIFYNLGAGDAFLTAVLCGWINLIFDVFFLKLKDLKPTASFCLMENVAFNETKLDLSSNLKISISLLDVVYSFVNSVILTLKESKTR